MIIKLSHDGFPEITHFPDSVLNERCQSLVLFSANVREFLNLFSVIQTNKYTFFLIQKTLWRTCNKISRLENPSLAMNDV